MTPRREPRRRSGAPPSGDKPSVMDTLVQSATVAVFHDCGVAVAPLAPMRISKSELSLEFPVGVMTFKGRGIDGAVMLSLPSKVCERVDMGRKPRPDSRDLMRELVNLVMGRAKNRLTLYRVTVTTGLPICRDRIGDLDVALNKPGALTVYPFRTLHGNVLVALKGNIDESGLVYSTDIAINIEGDIILF
jgi:hypothetical protein